VGARKLKRGHSRLIKGLLVHISRTKELLSITDSPLDDFMNFIYKRT
jgi:hypothetical protein